MRSLWHARPHGHAPVARQPVAAEHQRARRPNGRAAWRCGFVALLFVAALPSLALDPARKITQYVHESWTSNDGLPQDSINAIAQTPDGYLWLATQEGIARFDGINFTTWDARNTNGTVGNFVHTLFVDRSGTLWAGAGGGLLRHSKGTFSFYGVAHGFPDATARYISEDASGNLWVSYGTGRVGGGRGLVRFRDGQTQLFTTEHGLPGDQIYETFSDRSGALWMGTGNGLSVLRHGSVTTWTRADGLPDDLVRFVRGDRAGNIWAGTARGLARFDGRAFTTFTTRDGLPSDEIESLYEDRDGVLWVATARGIARLIGGRFEHPPIDGLREDRTFAFFEDGERNLWIGTHASGLHRLRAGKFTPYGAAEGLLGTSANGIFQDAGGKIWIGTVPGGVSILDEGSVVATWSPANGLPANNARAFAQDRAGVIWIGTSEGLLRFEDGRFTRFGTDEGLPHPSINVIHEDAAGTLWVGTNDGLARRRRGSSFETFPFNGDAKLSEVRILHQDVRGRLLAAGGDGLGVIDGDRFIPIAREVLGKANMTSLHEDRDGTLWLTSWSEGLFRVRDGKAFRFTSASGLFDDTAWSIVDDGHGDFWLGSNRGISRISRTALNDYAAGKIEKITPIVYGRGDGLRRRETNFGNPAALRSSDGRLWFGTTGGAVVIDPARVAMNRLAPNVVIERFLVNEREVTRPGIGGKQEPIILAAGSRSLEMHYTALALVDPPRVRYRYKLEGFDDHWIEAGSRRSAYYTNIDPGLYTFRVIAANEDGVWSPAGATLVFRLRPVFYRTWWFTVLAVAAALLLLLVVRRARRKQLEIRHRVYHDQLTGLPNRILLTERADVALKQGIRRGRSIAILFLDLDGFKGVNDLYGHAAGDEILQLVADRLRACIREMDTLARIGGDEFAVLVAEIDDETRAAEVAQRMIDAIRKGFPLEGETVHLGVSIGIAFHPYDGRDIPSILQAADRAMYRAKLAGGNAYQYNAADRDESVLV